MHQILQNQNQSQVLHLHPPAPPFSRSFLPPLFLTSLVFDTPLQHFSRGSILGEQPKWLLWQHQPRPPLLAIPAIRSN
uniref:Uncharacterized protein n=1 Tax=Kalanchoe fedtschenkoi TaxID=63787 RepID=A0A7N0ZW68_KALFE